MLKYHWSLERLCRPADLGARSVSADPDGDPRDGPGLQTLIAVKRERTILFVDDEDKSRKYFRRIFGRKYEVLIASNGQEAMEVIEQRRREIGMVVTDQIMPRATGLEVLANVERAARKTGSV